MSLRQYAYVYWSASFMVFTVVLASLFDPAGDRSTLALSFDADRVIAMISSPYLLVCVAFAVAGIAHANRVWASGDGFSVTDKMATIWFLMNACWYHTGCDIFSGLFQVMPNLRDCYEASNAAHLMPMHHPDRAYLDMVYWFEMFVQLPFCVLVYFLYLKKSRIRPPVETFLCALHLTGTVAYYLPNLLMGESSHPIMSNLDRGIALLWIFVPLALSVRAVRQVAEMTPALLDGRGTAAAG